MDGIIATISLPTFSGRYATWIAAFRIAPEEIPINSPSSVAARRAVTDRAQLADYCAGLRGVSLKILETEAGGPHDDGGVVAFEARLSYCGRAFVQRERSNFVREDGRWVYVDGQVR